MWSLGVFQVVKIAIDSYDPNEHYRLYVCASHTDNDIQSDHITYSTLNSLCFVWHPYGKPGLFKVV